MEQYSCEMQSYHDLWEEEYCYGVGMMMNISNSQGMISDSKEEAAASTNFYNAKNNPIAITNIPDQLHNMTINTTNQPNAADVATSVANPGNQKRRRSRGTSQSTTFLNASISNFRALVQQHTGCHNANVSPKGPITLCFANGDRRINNQYYYSS